MWGLLTSVPMWHAKYSLDDPRCEIGKLGEIAALIHGGYVLRTDPELESLTRIWIIKDMFESLQKRGAYHIKFILPDGVSRGVENLFLRHGSRTLCPPVWMCHSIDEDDKARVLAKIDDMQGGQD
eukprot:9855620-Heterocapsa_arctica.AAC.1